MPKQIFNAFEIKLTYCVRAEYFINTQKEFILSNIQY